MSREVVVSVLMPVHNAMHTIENAVHSILNQSFRAFELVIVDDGCTDKTISVIETIKDARIKLIRLGAKKGIVDALNIGLTHCHGKYIARMDADDWSYPTRLEDQVNFLKNNKEVGVCGCWFVVNNNRLAALPVAHEGLKYRLMNTNCFHHSGVMFKAELTHKLKPFYNPEFVYTEDLALWMNLIKITQFANIPKTLLWVNQGNGTHQKNLAKSGTDNTILRKQYLTWLFPSVPDLDAQFLAEQLNRIAPQIISKATFQKLITQFDKLFAEDNSPYLIEALNQAVWFKLASNAPKSLQWISLVWGKKYYHLKWWHPFWLVVKPIYFRATS